MVAASSLKDLVIAAASKSGRLPKFDDETLQKLADASTEFALAPDEFIDVGRLPPAVQTLDALIDHLKTIKVKLLGRDAEVLNKNWDVAKEGSLRLYKLFACCIAALQIYVSQTPYPSTVVTMGVFAENCCAHARIDKPPGLANKGAKLWEKTFEQGTSRTLAVMKALIFFCVRDTEEAESGSTTGEEGLGESI
jgi:hypothetical protein